MRSTPALVVTLAVAVDIGAIHQRSLAQPEPSGLAAVTLGTVPKITVAPAPPLQKEEMATIQELIGRLAEISSPDFGLSATLSGDTFLPISGKEQAGALLLTDHRIAHSEALRSLVSMGPRALPLLLSSLTDKTPTKLVVSHAETFGIMAFEREVPSNPVHPRERQARAAEPQVKRNGFEKPLTTYTVTVGDVCFVAIGQIVGRSYQAVRYQPTACVVINSPVHDPTIAQQLRAAWGEADSAQVLLDSLLTDFSTQSVFNGQSLDGWSYGSELRVGAATRLLFYFPEQSAELVAARLDALNVSAPGEEIGAYVRQTVANGVRAHEFIKAVAWSPSPAVRKSIRAVFDRTNDPEIVLACLPALQAGADVASRLKAELRRLPATESGPFGTAFHLLIALGRVGGPDAKEAFEEYLGKDHRGIRQCRTMCHALRSTHPEWAVPLLAPLLTDTRAADGWSYSVLPGQNEPRRPIRICDEAAETIALGNPDLPFTMSGEHADLDRQIEAMRKAIAERTNR